MLCNGDGVEKNEAEALKWLREAGRQGHDGARPHIDALEKRLALKPPLDAGGGGGGGHRGSPEIPPPPSPATPAKLRLSLAH
jgi:TPR repeat protein